jgi:mRNA interferase HigB
MPLLYSKANCWPNLTVRLFNLRSLREFWEQPGHEDAQEPLRAFYFEVLKANWANPNELRSRYPSADFVGNGRVIFNIKGNNYRLIAEINYSRQLFFVKFIGTHAEYDKIDPRTVDEY